MNNLISTIKWDMRFQIDNKLYAVGLVLALMWMGVMSLFPAESMQYVIPVVLLSDLATMGLLFMGAIAYFERGQGSIFAVVTTPLKTSEYLMSKVISLCLYVLAVNIPVVALMSITKDFEINYIFLILAIAATSVPYILAGFLLSSFFKSFTDFLLPMGLFFAFFNIPLLWMFEIKALERFSYHVYAIPSHGLVILLQSIFNPRPWYDIIYALAYNAAASYWLYRLCIKSFNKRILGRSRDIDA